MPQIASRALVAAVGIFVSVLAASSESHAQIRVAYTVAAEGAQRALNTAAAEAKKNGWNLSIAVVDNAGDLIAFLRMDGASVASVDVARAKARTAARFRRPTAAYDSTVAAGRVQILAFDGLIPVAGGVPIIVNGEVIGAIGASGATSAQDAQAAQAGAAAVQP